QTREGREGRAVRAAAHRAVAVVHVVDGAGDLVSHGAAETVALEHGDTSWGEVLRSPLGGESSGWDGQRAFLARPDLTASRSCFTLPSVIARTTSSALAPPLAVPSPASGATFEKVPSAQSVNVAFTW